MVLEFMVCKMDLLFYFFAVLHYTSPICEKQPLSHIFFKDYVIHLVMEVPLVLFTLDASDQSLVKRINIIHSYLAKTFQ